MQPSYNRQGANGSQSAASGGRWDAILADRQVSTSSSGNGNGNSYQRGGGGGGYSGNYSNRNGRDNSDGRFGGPRENNFGRREHEPHRPYHSHVGGQSSDTTGADWSTPLPANAGLER